jgi:hypothetical protein
MPRLFPARGISLNVDGNEVERCQLVGVGRRMSEERQYIPARPAEGDGATTIPDYERIASSRIRWPEGRLKHDSRTERSRVQLNW